MSVIEVTSLSTKGQVVIPNSIREKLKLGPGSKLMIIQDGDSILLKPIKVPKKEQFKKLIALGDRIREELNLKEEDIEKALKNARDDANSS